MSTAANNSPRQLNALGLAALENGRIAEAIGYFRDAICGDPAATALRMNLAKAHRLAGQDSEERDALEQALAIDQLHLMANIRLAELHERRDEPGSATDRWAMVLKLCSALEERPPEIDRLVMHARAYVEGRRNAMAQAVEAGMGVLYDRADENERRRAHAAAEVMLGRRSVYANQCHGFHYPFLPADEFFGRAHFPWLERLESQTSAIRDELQSILASRDPGLAPYIEMPPGSPPNLWSSLDRSPDWSALHLWRDGKRIDAVCDRAPLTAALAEALPLARIPGRAPAVFFSILKAGKRIPPHTGVTNVRSIVHLPLIVPANCGFRVGGETREWREGEAFVFDDTIEHEAWNESGEDRALLILDCWNPYLREREREMILRLFKISEEQRPDRPIRA